MNDVALIGGKRLSLEAPAAFASRPDLRFAIYGDLNNVDIAHSFLIVDLDILNATSPSSIGKFLEQSERLLKQDGTLPGGHTYSSVGRNFNSSSERTVVFVPDTSTVSYVFIHAGVGSDEKFLDVRRILSRISNAYPFVFSSHIALIDIVEKYIPLMEKYEVKEVDGELEITGFDPKQFVRIDHADFTSIELLSHITQMLGVLHDRLRGDNSFLGGVLKGQVLTLIDGVKLELQAPLVEKHAVEAKARDLREISTKIGHLTKDAASLVSSLDKVVQAIQKLLSIIF